MHVKVAHTTHGAAFCLALSSDIGSVQADLCHMAVLGAGSSFEARRLWCYFLKEKEIVCVCVHAHRRESARALTTCFNKPSSHSKREACPSVTGSICLGICSSTLEISLTRGIFLW